MAVEKDTNSPTSPKLSTNSFPLPIPMGIVDRLDHPSRQSSRVDRISLVSTLESHNHPVNIGLSTCQPLKCPPPEKINTTVGIPARRAKTSPGHLQSCHMPFAIAAVGRLGVVKQRIGSPHVAQPRQPSTNFD